MFAKISLHDDAKAFFELFECAVEACVWPTTQWVVCLLPLLIVEAQLVAQWVVLQWVSYTPEQHHQRFCSLTFSDLGHLFTFAQ